MLGFEKVRNYIKNLDQPEGYRFTGMIFGMVILLITIILFMYYRSVGQLKRQLIAVNKQREEVRSILEKHHLILEQQAHVNELLAQDKNFRLKDFFMNMLQSLQLTPLLSREPEIVSSDLMPGYTEIKLEAIIHGMNMKQLTDLLYKIEQHERVYTRDLKITKTIKNHTIDVSLVIATFEVTAPTE